MNCIILNLFAIQIYNDCSFALVEQVLIVSAIITIHIRSIKAVIYDRLILGIICSTLPSISNPFRNKNGITCNKLFTFSIRIPANKLISVDIISC